MPLPTPTDIAKMGFSHDGLPFVDVPSKSTVLLYGMGYSLDGLPFVSNEFQEGPEPPTPSEPARRRFLLKGVRR